MDPEERRDVPRAARQPPPAPVCAKAGEDPPLHDQGEGSLPAEPRQTLGGTGMLVCLRLTLFQHFSSTS